MEKAKEYLKMADVFRNEMRVIGDSNNMIADDVGIIIGCYSGDMMAEYVLHAINSHDELVAEVERLRESNKRMATAIWSKWEREGIFTHNSEGQADIFRELYLCDPSSGSEAE